MGILNKKVGEEAWEALFGKRQEIKKLSVAEPEAIYHTPVLNYANQLVSASALDLEHLEIPGKFIRQLESATALDAIQLASILGMSKSKYYRIIKEKVLELNEVDILSNFLKVWKKGINAFDGIFEDFEEFLKTTNTNLGAVKPITLLKTESGRREVEKAIDRIEYGLYG